MGIYNTPLTLEWTLQVWDWVIDPYASGMLYILLIENIASQLNRFQIEVMAFNLLFRGSNESCDFTKKLLVDFMLKIFLHTLAEILHTLVIDQYNLKLNNNYTFSVLFMLVHNWKKNSKVNNCSNIWLVK